MTSCVWKGNGTDYTNDRCIKLGSRWLLVEPTNSMADGVDYDKHRVELEYGLATLPDGIKWWVVCFTDSYLCNASFDTCEAAMEFFNSVTPEQLQSGELA